jgi:hypothetical protein
VSQAQAQATAMPFGEARQLPSGTAFITRDPYSELDDDGFWSTRNILLIACLGGGAILLAVIALIGWLCWYKSDKVRPATASFVDLCLLLWGNRRFVRSNMYM